jgi:hypothetical protein
MHKLRSGELAPLIRHRLSDFSEDGRTAVCTICGPTEVRPAREGRGAECMTVRKRHRRGKKSPRKYFLRKKYGLSLSDYQTFLDRADGACEICSKPFEGEPHVDHDHATGVVRGLLCRACNLGLGFMADDTIRLGSAIAYLERNTA